MLIGAKPPPIGGTTVLFEQLVRDLAIFNELQVTTLNIGVRREDRFGKIVVSLITFWQCLLQIPYHDSIGFHGSVRGVTLFTPVLYCLSKIYRRRLIVRTFGGGFDLKYDSMPYLGRIFFRLFVLRCDCVLFETKVSVNKFSAMKHQRIEWYPNSRPIAQEPPLNTRVRNNARNFVFLSHVKKDKGILVLLEAFHRLGDSVHLHIYGPIIGSITHHQLTGKNHTYHGIALPKDVAGILSTMDVLVLPTFYVGEGYPGAILEAYANGLPVITTNWRCIPEIVCHGSGILVRPGSIEDITRAVKRYTESDEFYKSSSSSALKMADYFDSQKWSRVYLDILLAS